MTERSSSLPWLGHRARGFHYRIFVPARMPRAPIGLRLVEVNSIGDRKSTRLNSSHSQISYAVFCLKKKKIHDVVMQGAVCSRRKRSRLLQERAGGINHAIGNHRIGLTSVMSSYTDVNSESEYVGII